MQIFDAKAVRERLTIPSLIRAIEVEFLRRDGIAERYVTEIGGPDEERLLLSMPSFRSGGGGVVKLASFISDNPRRGLPTIQSVIVVFSDAGTPYAILDGTTVTHLRTGAASAIASKFLSREDSHHLVMIGTGVLAPAMVVAHCAVRPIAKVSVCGRNPARSQLTVEAIRSCLGGSIEIAVLDVADAVPQGDIICCATNASKPVLKGEWIRPGTFIDLVGSFSPDKREADDATIMQARVFVDTMQGALSEAGDILGPLSRGVIGPEWILGDLAGLISGRVVGRQTADEITLFKSVGTAIEDLAAAHAILDQANAVQSSRQSATGADGGANPCRAAGPLDVTLLGKA